MSDYSVEATNPRTAESEKVIVIDNHFGKGRYGVRFKDGETVPLDEIDVRYILKEEWK